MKLLDLGCGSGSKTHLLLKKGEVFGIDISENAIKTAKKHFADAHFQVADASKLPFEDNFFDEVHAYDVLEHVEDLNKVLSEINRVIKKDGQLVVEIPNSDSEKILTDINSKYPQQIGHKRCMSLEKWIALLNKNGLTVQKVVPKHFIETLYLAHKFSKGSAITDQQGSFDDKDDDFDLLMKLNYLNKSEFSKSLGAKKVDNFEKTTGVKLDELRVLLRLSDDVLAPFFPKTYRLECTANNAKQKKLTNSASKKSIYAQFKAVQSEDVAKYEKQLKLLAGTHKSDVENYKKELENLQKSLKIKENELKQCYQFLKDREKQLEELRKVLKIKDDELTQSYKFLKDREKQVKQLIETRQSGADSKKETGDLRKVLKIKDDELTQSYKFLKDREKQLEQLSGTYKSDVENYKKQLENLQKSLKIKDDELTQSYKFLKDREKQLEDMQKTLSTAKRKVTVLEPVEDN
ncbi:MAG: methyltransferase domain-containing protein [Candidatus Micrarchaeia archaeon]